MRMEAPIAGSLRCEKGANPPRLAMLLVCAVDRFWMGCGGVSVIVDDVLVDREA